MRKLILPILLNLFAFGIVFGQTSPAPKIVNQPTFESKKKPPLDLSSLVGLKGQTAPTFMLPSMNGTEYNLEKMRGQIVAINLWGTFCPPCITEMPELNSLVKKYKDKNVVFLAPTPDDKAVLEGFLQKYRFDYQVLPNGFGVVEKYAPHTKSVDPQKKGGFMMLLPTHLVIDQTGVVTYHEWGFRKDTAALISQEIEKLLTKNKSKINFGSGNF
ncbi:MAG TPA: TlpA disulfide reductase family protein [Pyrinomonadaceae bacterium]|nr:TlpA disulfide reductase family protein [Pyrinomonadaceae bacterium]